MEGTLTKTGIKSYFESRSEHGNYEAVRDWLVEFFEAFDVSLRSIGQAIHHLGLVLASLRKDRGSLYRTRFLGHTFALRGMA